MTEKEKDIYFLKRKKAKIRLRDIAKELGVGVSWLSRFETEPSTMMAVEKMEKYRRIIDRYYQ